MISLKPIKKGDQIFNDFGQLPRSDLLRRYGYVTDRYQKWDVVEIDLAAVSTAAVNYIGLSTEEREQRVPTRRTSYRLINLLMSYSFALLLNGQSYRTAMTCVDHPELIDSILMTT